MFTLTPYDRRHLDDILDLAETTDFFHTHLDWYAIDQWLDAHAGPVLLAWAGRRLAGVIGLSAPMGGICWVRLLALRRVMPVRLTLDALWEEAQRTLRASGVREVVVMVAQDWLLHQLPGLNLTPSEQIITLSRGGGDLPPPRNRAVRMRPAELHDLAAMLMIDHAAFQPPWQLSAGDLRAALRMAASCKLAYFDGRMVGYQLSTRFEEHGHLARLAVLPDTQGSGVGGALLDDLIRSLTARGVRLMTVNTQASNLRSQRLYAQYGFRRNGYDLPVWSLTL